MLLHLVDPHFFFARVFDNDRVVNVLSILDLSDNER